MSDLLSRGKLFNKLATAQTLADAFAVIQGMDTEDAEYVVRCGDCIRYRPDDDVWGRCTVSGKMRRKDYCSYGVRKDGETHG